MGLRRSKKSKNPPILSHEFVIQNHADIISCVAMVFVVGLMFQISSPIASLFVTLQHNITLNETDTTFYKYGHNDFCTAFFYLLICVVIHAVVQEYLLDKLNSRIHLSKTKHNKFNESGQLLVFYAVSAFWGADIIIRESLVSNINRLWENYPHSLMPYLVKFYFIVQIAYWIHCFPELYFQKIKREEIPARLQYIILYLVFITGAYLLNFTRVALCMLVLHYLVEMVFHISRLLYFSNKSQFANVGFNVWNFVFVSVRIVTITLAVLTFWYGLPKSSAGVIDFVEGNYNTQVVRINCLAAVSLLQAWMMWNFITFHVRRRRELNNLELQQAKKKPSALSAGSPKRLKKAKATTVKKDEDSSASDTAESNPSAAAMPIDNGTVRQRAPIKAAKKN